MTHIPVLLQEVVNALAVQKDDTVLDATLGLGGHARALGSLLSAKGTLIGIDADGHALAKAKENLSELSCRKVLEKHNFADLETFFKKKKITKIDKALFDLGWGTHTLAHKRGFSFQGHDEPLLMTYNDNPGNDTLTAREILNTWSAETLVLIFKKYGGEGRARAIADEIIATRNTRPFDSVQDLLECIERVYPTRGKLHPATKVFQALRITVNNELAIIPDALDLVRRKLTPGGRIAVITFHSTEDTVVKRVFQQWKKEKYGTLLNKHVIKATHREQLENPRSRSAQLRVFQKI
jgi:16S rRNA (cytosine1402-N4)-methyltransferase